MRFAALILSAFIVAPTLAMASPRCDAPYREKAAFAPLEIEGGSGAPVIWKLPSYAFWDEFAETLEEFCAKNPGQSLSVAYDQLFGSLRPKGSIQMTGASPTPEPLRAGNLAGFIISSALAAPTGSLPESPTLTIAVEGYEDR